MSGWIPFWNHNQYSGGNMFHGRKWSVLSLIVLLFSIQAIATEPEAIPGEYLVKLKPMTNVMSGRGQTLSQRLGAYVKSSIPELNIVVVKRAVVETQRSAIKTLNQNPLVEYSEPNYIYRINKMPNDPDFGKLWGLTHIQTEKAWDLETGSEKTLVAVIDTGIDYNHPDLKNNVWTNEAELNGKPSVDDDGNGIIDDIHGANFVDAEKPTGDPLDDHGHGSHCSGTIGASGDDGKGIVGVSWKVKILGAKFLSADGSGSLEGAVKAIAYSNKMGAKVLSNSWGGGGFSQALKDIIEETNKSGAVFIAAAGNESNNNDANPSYPASYEVANVVSVAATDINGGLASFSNYGKKLVHLGAPGVDIYSSVKGGGYDSWSGTSMATPHVSGVAALLASHDPNMTGVEIKQRIITTTTTLPSLRGKTSTGGVVNAYNALTNTLTPIDQNDPANWKTMSIDVQSAHPYKSKTNEVFEVRALGAKEFALYFSRFETERNYDFVTIYDVKGNILFKLSGINNDSLSQTIQGDYAKIVFTSDDSVEGHGFEITKIHFR